MYTRCLISRGYHKGKRSQGAQVTCMTASWFPPRSKKQNWLCVYNYIKGRQIHKLVDWSHESYHSALNWTHILPGLCYCDKFLYLKSHSATNTMKECRRSSTAATFRHVTQILKLNKLFILSAEFQTWFVSQGKLREKFNHTLCHTVQPT